MIFYFPYFSNYFPYSRSAHCPGGQTFLSEKHLNEFANHIDLVKMI